MGNFWLLDFLYTLENSENSGSKYFCTVNSVKFASYNS